MDYQSRTPIRFINRHSNGDCSSYNQIQIGGPFGVEDSVRAGGGLVLYLSSGFILILGIPEALVTAELA
ncbi:hypothetical protein Leryth_016025 [Lithospermum erythrorhizon]|nr:hypothetical protein Leryth_016025 [Lithospermum erythrorhizon]